MKVLQVNTVYGKGSTGKIVKDIHDICKNNDIQCLSAYRCRKKEEEIFEDTIEVSTEVDSRVHGVLARFTMFKGCFSIVKTMHFINKVSKYAPDIIHLHNLHGSYINLPLLFNYIKKKNISVVWTLHDCWGFTAICPHFSIVNCDKWKTGCQHCPQRSKYSSSPVDNTKYVWNMKKKWFTGMENVVIVTPSCWLEKLVKESFLKPYLIKTINNGIDLSIFKEVPSDFKKRYDIENKKIVLAVAFAWSYEKGLDVIFELARHLSDEYKMVVVGLDESTKKEDYSNILIIPKTNSQRELAEIYTAADVFINPTREEVLGLVNIEALACGTPVITFDSGGSPECVDKTCGSVVKKNDVEMMEKEIIRVCTEHPYSKENCIKRAMLFDKNQRLEEYISLYNSFK